MKLWLANPRGFCAGVDRAISIVETVLARYGAPIYVRHEVVHNTHVVARLRGQGVIFVETLAEVPDQAIVIFSAHGTPKKVADEAQRRGLTVFDATCPLVTKVHSEVARMVRSGIEIIMIGHAGHPEVEGTMGQCVDGAIQLVETVADVARIEVKDQTRLGYVTQTTLSQDDASNIIAALRERFPAIQCPKKDDICYATQNRQNAVRRLAERVQLMIIVGSPNSSNSNRLREAAERNGILAYRIDSAAELQRDWFVGVSSVGITAGASAPEILVRDVIEKLREWGVDSVTEDEGVIEKISFSLPKALQETGDI